MAIICRLELLICDSFWSCSGISVWIFMNYYFLFHVYVSFLEKAFFDFSELGLLIRAMRPFCQDPSPVSLAHPSADILAPALLQSKFPFIGSIRKIAVCPIDLGLL